METKKSKRADLEPKKSIFLQIGLIVALGLSLAAFEWETPYKELVIPQQWKPLVDDIFIKENYIVDKKPAPIPLTAPLIKTVSNDQKITEDLFINSEIKPDDEQPAYIPPAPVKLETEKSVPEDIPFIIVEKMPEFPGGISALKEFLAKNTDYPVFANESRIQGTVYIYFVVEKDGSVSNVKTIRGIGGGCNEEAERVIASLPTWTPGEQQGRRVRVSFTIPVAFKLQ